MVADKLASRGLKYTRFHTTAICSPSRAALLTGRNHHRSGFGFLMEWATGYPSYNCMIPRRTATVGELLKQNGYSTSWLGKNHNTPDWETSVAGPFDRWPGGLGFDYFYGFHAGETHQYDPVIFENTNPVEPSKSPEEGYHFMSDMTDKWELYHLDEDFSEAVDLAAKMPEKLAELKSLWEEAAKNNGVYPLDDRGAGRLASPKPPVPGSNPDAKTVTF